MSRENQTLPSNQCLMYPVSAVGSLSNLAFVSLQVRFPGPVNILPWRLVMKSVL